ncbi:hypothetical protein N9W73_01145 [Gammaproteobacteria bacterium]|nr:hypothetical protein [Gammaproteobacteria bacterium]
MNKISNLNMNYYHLVNSDISSKNIDDKMYFSHMKKYIYKKFKCKELTNDIKKFIFWIEKL